MLDTLAWVLAFLFSPFGLVALVLSVDCLGFVGACLGEIVDLFVGPPKPPHVPVRVRATASPLKVESPVIALPKRKRRKRHRFDSIKFNVGNVLSREKHIHLDEDSSSRLLFDSLRAWGFSVTRTIGDLKQISDSQQLEYALGRRAILVTHDKGLFQTCNQHRHCGVVWAPRNYPDQHLAEFCRLLGRNNATSA